MNEFTSSPLFGIVLCIVSYECGVRLNRKTKSPLANPLLIAIVLVILVLKLFQIPLASFQNGGNFVALFLAPATASLALKIYSQMDVLKKNLLPVLIGSAVGSAVSMTSVFLLCNAFSLDAKLTASLLPKSVTTPIAMEISSAHGGLIPVTVAAVVITGIIGAMFAPALIKLLKLKSPVAAGVAIGTSSHALGTSKAIELGEVEGALSGVAIGTSGIITVLFSLLVG